MPPGGDASLALYFCHSILGRSIAPTGGARKRLLLAHPSNTHPFLGSPARRFRASPLWASSDLSPQPVTCLDAFLARVRRMLSPVRLTRWELCTMRSRIASA